MKMWPLLLLLAASPAVATDHCYVHFNTVPPCRYVVVVTSSTENRIMPDPHDGSFPLPATEGSMSLRFGIDDEHEEPGRTVTSGELHPIGAPADAVTTFPPEGAIDIPARTPVRRLLDFVEYRSGGWLIVATCCGGLGALVYRRRLKASTVQRDKALREVVELQTTLYEGRIVETYRIGRKLGEGGMGTVHEAIDSNDASHRVAVKFIAAGTDPDAMGRAHREIQAMVNLKHPNIMRLYSYGETPAYFYIVMELIEGGTLQDRLQPTGLPLHEVVQILRPVVDAVQRAHHLGFVHRDLKPANIMFTSDGVIRVMDFGLARKEQVTAKITATGAILGTPAYMAPEQIQSLPVTAAVDQYSLGIMIFEMLTGQLPFDGDPMSLLLHHLNDKPPLVSERVPGLPAMVDEVIARMLAKDAAHRYPDLGIAMADLEAAAAVAR